MMNPFWGFMLGAAGMTVILVLVWWALLCWNNRKKSSAAKTEDALREALFVIMRVARERDRKRGKPNGDTQG